MIISRKWLQQYIDISDLAIEEIAEKLTNSGSEVEGIQKMSQGTNLVIANVIACVDHPDSDHLHLCQVDLGDEIVQIVCGAPNVTSGIKVIVARVHAMLPGGEIKESTIRGQVSKGMICSLLELGVDAHYLSEESKNGIEILPSDAPLGDTNPLGYLGLDDEILDVGLTPNRNDCMAAWAMAQELGAILGREVHLPCCKQKEYDEMPTTLHVASETKKCPLFLGKIIHEIQIKPSPKWMQELLMAAGIKSINNVVDISNFVMLETGQPVHFYDMAAIPEKEITVKDQIQEEYTALDGECYDLKEEDIVITSNHKPIGIAGIMGGNDSKIEASTKGIIIEVAQFDHVSIRNTARRLHLNTDASIRYQKGIEPLAADKAMHRACDLLVRYADATGIEKTAQYGTYDSEPIEFDIRVDRINKQLGTDFTHEEVMRVLTQLQLAPEPCDKAIHIKIPSYRMDLRIEQDIAEEIIRILGYDRLPSTMPQMASTLGALHTAQKVKRRIRQILCGLGYNEALSYTLVDKKKVKGAIMGSEDVYELASPMSEEHRYIRNSILPSLLDCIAYNQARNHKDIALFEISNTYQVGKVEERLCVVASGVLQQNRWQKYEVKVDFYTLKGLLEALLENLGFDAKRVQCKENTIDHSNFHPYRSAQIYLDKKCIGMVGELHPTLAKQYDIVDTLAMEITLDAVLHSKPAAIKYKEISKFPSISRDLAFVVQQDCKVGDIIKGIRKNGKVGKENIIQAVDVFDVYTGEHVQSGYKSIALRISFQSNTRTLNDQEINTIHDKILQTLTAELGAQLRS